METLFFIIIVLLLIVGLIYYQMNNKENMMGNNYKQNMRLENTFRKDQISYYKNQDTKYNTKCDESKFVKLASGNTKLKEFGVCDFFSGKKVIENFNADKIKPMESTQYAQEIEHCRLLNQSMKSLNVNNDAPLKDIISQLHQIPEFLQIKTDDNTEDDKGCGYCFDGNGAGEVLYGDSLGPFKNAGGKGVCKTWIKPGDIRRGGGTDLQNNKWRSEDDVEQMKFGGNQGVIDDSIKIHEQQICSRVNDCGDLDGEKSICGWCYMGRKGDGKGEGMVAAVDENGNKIGETKYMDDYCPWPGEVSDSGKSTNKWTGPTEGSAWLKEESNKELSAADIQRIDLELQSELKNKLNAKKNDGSLETKIRLEADKAMKYVEDKIKFIMNFGGSKSGQDKYKMFKDKLKTGIGDEKNNQFLFKCGQTTQATKDNIFFLHSYNGLSREQKIVLKGLHETHEFFKKCQSNVEILGEKITLKNHGELITKCNKLSNILNKPENKKLKDAFMAMDLSKDKAGCLENCALKGGRYEFNSELSFFKNWWKKKEGAKECVPLSLDEIKNIVGYDQSKADGEDGEKAPTLENSTCCNDIFEECSDAQEKCKRCDADINEASCRQYAIDIGLDPSDKEQYNSDAYVNQGYPFGCSVKLDGSQVIWVGQNKLDEIEKRHDKNKRIRNNLSEAQRKEGESAIETRLSREDSEAANRNLQQIRDLEEKINDEENKKSDYARQYHRTSRRNRTQRNRIADLWWSAYYNANSYRRQKNNLNSIKNSFTAKSSEHSTLASKLYVEAQVKKRETPDSILLDNKPFKNPTTNKDGRSEWYSVCSLKENKVLVYPNLVAKAFRKDPTPGLRDNVKRWDKIINGERKIKSFQELIKIWLESKMQIEGGLDNNDVKNYKSTITNIWNIFIELAKKKNPGLFNVDIGLARNNVLGNGSLNTSDKRRKLAKYEVAELKSKKLDPLIADDGSFIERKGWRHTSVERNGNMIAGERLMITPGECTALEESFPCFKNWMGKKDASGNFPGQDGYNPNNPMGHSEACYNELWNSQTQKNFKSGSYGNSCFVESGNKTFMEQVSKSFKKYDNKPDSTSLWLENSKYWQRSTIPSLKIDIEKIRKTADKSNQYEPIYTYDDENLTKEQITAQINNSAKVATLACYNREPTFPDQNGNTEVPYACENRFRDKDYNFPRPKECMNYYWKKNTENNIKFASTSSTFSFKDPSSWNKNEQGEQNDFHILSDKYNPYPHLDNETLGNVWGIANLPKAEFQDKLDFNFTNKQLDDKLKGDVEYIRTFQGKTKPTSKEYDKYLLKKRYIFEYINEDEDGIWQNLKPGQGATLTISDDNYRASTMKLSSEGKPWVKMCWGDFKESLLKEFRGTVKEDGDGTLNIGREPKLRKIIDGAEHELYRKIVKTKDKKKYNPKYGNFNSGGAIKFELDYPTSITERLYDKTWFPFWRFFAAGVMSSGTKYYQREAYNENEKAQHFQTTKRGKNFQKIEKTRPISGTVVVDYIPNNIIKEGSDASGKPSLIHLELNRPAYLHKITINGIEIGDQGWGAATHYTLSVKKNGTWMDLPGQTSKIRRGSGRNTTSRRTLSHDIKYSFNYPEDYEFEGDGKISEIKVVGTKYGGVLSSGHQVYYKGFQNASVEYFNTDGSDDKVELEDKNPEYFEVFKDYSETLKYNPKFTNTTVSGRTCQNWTKDTPHRRNSVVKKSVSKGLHDVGNHNYCRDPDAENEPWCYTTDPKKRWETCKDGGYSTTNKTKSGKTCQNWSSDSPHGRNSKVKKAYKNRTHGMGDHNYCRDPDGEGKLWCYTTSRSKRWEFCQ